jgi:hypothetical protein
MIGSTGRQRLNMVDFKVGRIVSTKKRGRLIATLAISP